jgi:small subunit ribosomal protein S27Ae
MQIFVKDQTTLVLEVPSGSSIGHVKELIELKGVHVGTQRLVHAGRSLDDDLALLVDCGVAEESTLHLVPSLVGGAKKRKKKNYTTPKKNKHKKKKVKLSVLKYYKVDENGKITRLRRECPNKDCGAGVFMASHFDRQYCGKCCLTFVFNKPKEDE